MKTLLTIALLGAAAFPALAEPNALTAAEKSEGWRLLFNGKDLSGWDGDPEVWSVENGAILGSTENKDLEANTFLITRERYSDFVLQVDIKLRNHNSGIQFRSEAGENWVVKGYQADAAQGAWWGSLYGEKTGRGVIAEGWKAKGETVVRPGGWNHYEIISKGAHITLKLNGLKTVEIDDEMSSSGVIALQVHRGPKMEVRFRNLKLKKL